MSNIKSQGVIFGVKTGKIYHYIGKTSKPLDENGNVKKSDVGRRYTNPKIKQVFADNQDSVTTEILHRVEVDWYDEKLLEVINKYKDKHPLLNAKFMLEGKRGVWQDTGGYWQGKKRDANTLKMLSESKYVKVVQYDSDGNLVKVWKSCKEPAILIFKDYRVENGGSISSLYSMFKSNCIKSRFKHNCYWFKLDELSRYFGRLPEKIDIEEMKRKEKDDKRAKYNYGVHTHAMRATVVHKDLQGNTIKIYQNSAEAAYILRTSVQMVQRFCRGLRYNPNYLLSYGEKTLQAISIKYPKYKKVELLKYEKPKKVEVRYKVSTSVELYKYSDDGMVLIDKFNSCRHAAQALGMDEAKIRRICMGTTKSDLILKYGEKKKFIVE
jgi:hypothetical protein